MVQGSVQLMILLIDAELLTRMQLTVMFAQHSCQVVGVDIFFHVAAHRETVESCTWLDDLDVSFQIEKSRKD